MFRTYQQLLYFFPYRGQNDRNETKLTCNFRGIAGSTSNDSIRHPGVTTDSDPRGFGPPVQNRQRIRIPPRRFVPPYQTYSLMTETNLQKGGLVHWVPCTKSRENVQQFEISFDEK